MTLILNNEEIQQALSVNDCLSVMEEAYRELADSQGVNRPTTFFLNNMGTGVQFATLGYAVYRDAREKSFGRELPTDWFLQDIKP